MWKTTICTLHMHTPRGGLSIFIYVLWYIVHISLHIIYRFGLVWYMVFNATFNNISVISWRSVLLVEETGGPGENHRPVASN